MKAYGVLGHPITAFFAGWGLVDFVDFIITILK